jgi:glucokinase
MSASRPGRPSTSAPFCALGVDVGGTKTAAGLVTFPHAKVVARRVIPTQPSQGGERVLEEVLHLAEDLASKARAQQLTVQGVGVGVCELVDRSGKIVSAHSLGWRTLPVRERLGGIAPTTIEADVRAAALGESLFGSGKPFHIFVYVTVGTGISSCLMIDGAPFLGARGATGTIASSPLPSTGDAPMPSLEQLASGPALVARFNQAGGRAQCGQDVLAAAASGDARATAVVGSAGEALGAAIGWWVNGLDPEAIVIGGGLGLSEGLYAETTIASARRHIWSELNRDLPILQAALGSDAGLIGAAAAAWKQFGKTTRKKGRKT